MPESKSLVFLALALALGATTAQAAKVDKFAATYQQMDSVTVKPRSNCRTATMPRWPR